MLPKIKRSQPQPNPQSFLLVNYESYPCRRLAHVDVAHSLCHSHSTACLWPLSLTHASARPFTHIIVLPQLSPHHHCTHHYTLVVVPTLRSSLVIFIPTHIFSFSHLFSHWTLLFQFGFEFFRTFLHIVVRVFNLMHFVVVLVLIVLIRVISDSHVL